MEYMADTQVSHEDLDEFVRVAGQEGWILRHILECRPAGRNEDLVTLIWERGDKISVTNAPAELVPSHECSYESTSGGMICRVCGKRFEDYMNETNG